MKKCYFSKRIYKHTLKNTYVHAISRTLFVFNQAKGTVLNTLVKEERSKISRRKKLSLQLFAKSKYNLNDYYTNSAVQEANALFSSQKELKKLYISNKEAHIKSVKKKIKTTKSRLTTLQKIKQSFVKGKPSFNQTSREQKMGKYFIVQFKNKTDIYINGYLFEHTYLDVETSKLKNRLGRLKFRLDRLEKQLCSLKNNVSNATFGSKKLFKSQFTIDRFAENHSLWKEKWKQHRYNKMTISGRKDAKHGNFVFSYHIETNVLSFQTPDGVCVDLPVLFPYGQKEVNETILNQLNCKDKQKFGKPIAWSIEDHVDYYIVKCIIDIDENPSKNYSKTDGVLGVDLNVDHFAWSHINSKGQLVKTGVMKFDIENKSSGQITKLIEAEAIGLVDMAVVMNKPIALEKLDTTKSKVSNAYGNKKANRRMSQFAYSKMISAIKNRADKMGVAVFDINPAYTSQIGKIKYMKRLGVSIHQAASYVIARRAMGFKETLPPVLHSLLPEKITGLHHWVHWKWVSHSLSDVRKHVFYSIELANADRIHLGELFPPGALTDLELKGLSKLASR